MARLGLGRVVSAWSFRSAMIVSDGRLGFELACKV